EGLSSGDFDGFDDQLFSSGLFWISFLALWIFVFVSFAGMVVNWHRFVLVEEYPGWWTSPFRSNHLLSYVLLTIGIGVLCTLGGGLIGAISGGISAVAGQPVMFFLIFFGLGLPAYVLAVRMMLCLPSRAIGEPMTFSEAVLKTKGAFWTILVAVLCVLVFSVLLGLLEDAITALSGFLGVLTSVAFLPFNMLLFASMLTTFYGYFIEDRDLM
ncbi:MAG: hypothetical protein HRU31_12160, partial [Rhodobacteraceae bacterium]|nr:hypothetical protein [Paracoccaceae bacterium]